MADDGALTIDENGWLRGCRHLPSPNCDDRPANADIDLIVVHSISLPPGEYGGEAIEQLFTNRLNPAAHPYFATLAGLKVSAHALIRRDGEIIQFVPFQRRAWHAGVSSYCGRERCNDFSIGIELEGTDDSAFEDIQYHQLARLIGCLQGRYPAIGARITGHSDIAPGRKTDPGSGFDWARLKAML